MVLKDLAFADIAAAIMILPIGPISITARPLQKVTISDALFVGRSASGCDAFSTPSLYACLHYTAQCGHLGPARRGIIMPAFAFDANMAPKVADWNSVDAYAAFAGTTSIERVTFAHYGKVS